MSTENKSIQQAREIVKQASKPVHDDEAGCEVPPSAQQMLAIAIVAAILQAASDVGGDLGGISEAINDTSQGIHSRRGF